ncbi:T6SS protein Cts1A [Citrobacter freundii]|nr:T6SS protein Cts1A [Citrobacter freundii]
MNIDELLAPVTPERPCGDNLDYDTEFLAMEQAMQVKAEQQFGDTIIPAEPADWTKVEELAISLLSRTKDIRIMLALTHSWTITRGLSGYADGLLLMQQALSLYWQQIYPLLDEFGETDAYYRINVLAGLGDKSDLTISLRNVVLLDSNGDFVTLRDAQTLLDGSKIECASYPGGRSRLIDELVCRRQGYIDTVLIIHQRLQTIRKILSTHLGEGCVPEMDQLQKNLSLVVDAIQNTDLSLSNVSRDGGVASEPASIYSTKKLLPVEWKNIQITSRSEAHLMLEKVRQYFAQHEPGHPAPLIIERVQRLTELDFMGIIRELAPDSVHQLENILGHRD